MQLYIADFAIHTRQIMTIDILYIHIYIYTYIHTSRTNRFCTHVAYRGVHVYTSIVLYRSNIFNIMMTMLAYNAIELGYLASLTNTAYI